MRVRVVRDGAETYRGSFPKSARVRLGTTTPAPFAVAVDVLPAKGYGYVGRQIPIALRAPTVGYGYQGPFVAALLDRLRSLGYAAPSSRSVFDSDAQQAVYAFQKAQRLERTGVADAAFWRRLAKPSEIVPRYTSPADHIEIDKQRQILMIVRDGRVALISPVSTAGIAGYYTPVGRFAISRKVPGYDPSPLGVLYKPMYFYGGYAIHGNPSVPPYPASHGCIRVPNFVADRLFESEPYGEVVFVYLPDLGRYSGALGAWDAQAYGGPVLQLVESVGLRAIDVAAAFAQRPEPCSLFQGHYTEEGYRLAVDTIADGLARR